MKEALTASTWRRTPLHEMALNSVGPLPGAPTAAYNGFGFLENKRDNKKKKQRIVVSVSTAGSISIAGRQQENVKIQVDGMQDEAGLRRKNFPQVSVGKNANMGGRAKKGASTGSGQEKKNLHDKAHFLFSSSLKSLARACGSTEMASEFLQSSAPPHMFRVLRVLPICVRGPAAPQAPASAYWLACRVPGWRCDAVMGPDGGPCRAREGYSPL
ncbi:hypothetical protein HDV64DRAFT_140059 [Trichoderma sp. TUCIM 5745]